MLEIPGFPHLHKEYPTTETRTRLGCPHCGSEVVLDESIWVSEYTNERFIWCEACRIQVGCVQSAPNRPPEPDST